MRLSTDPDRDEPRSIDTLCTALAGGIRLLDTAHAYGWSDGDVGHNERLLVTAVRASGIDPAAIRVVTKVGMRRPDGGWEPDGRARTIEEGARASREALGALSIDCLMLHALDPKTALTTTMRALARELERGTARSIGVCNVTRTQLEEAMKTAPITCVQVALGAFDDASARGGLVRFCADRGISVLAHSPLGGPKRAPRLSRDRALVALAGAVGCTPIELVIAYLARVHPSITPLVGARRPESARSLLTTTRAPLAELPEDVLVRLDARFPSLGALRQPPTPEARRASRGAHEPACEVVLLVGIPGAGKSRAARAFTSHERLNRDERGGTLKGLARALDERLAAGATAVILDGTYATRATRNDVIVAAERHGARIRCVHVDTPLHEAQTNVVLRMLERHGRLLGPEEIAQAQADGDANMVRPGVLFRMARELEPPAEDEGFDAIEVLPFARAHGHVGSRVGAAIALDTIVHELDGEPALRDDAVRTLGRAPEGAACLLVAWRPDATTEWRTRLEVLASALGVASGRSIELGVCPHPAGPPVCWCRPPLPGLWLEFARRHALDAANSVSIGRSPASATMARALGLTHLVVVQSSH